MAAAQFKARVRLLYDGATEAGNITLNASRLRDYVHLLGIRGADEAQVSSNGLSGHEVVR